MLMLIQKSALNTNYSDSETRVLQIMNKEEEKQQHTKREEEKNDDDDGLRKEEKTACNDVNYTFIMSVCVILVIHICHSL